MDLVSFSVLTLVGLVGGFMAGFFGIGGGVIIIPLLMYGAGIPIKLATGISMVQAVFASLSGLTVHRGRGTLDLKLGVILGLGGITGGLLGSIGSAGVAERTLLSLYLFLVVSSLVLLFLAPRQEKSESVKVNLWTAIPTGLGVGVLGGMLGVGGGFVLIPLMISVLRIPTRIAVGTSLVVVLMVTLAGATGKIATGQFDLQTAAYVIAGSIVGAQVGGRVSARVSPRVIRASLVLMLMLIMIRTAIDLIST